MKRLYALLLVLLIAMPLTACGSEKKPKRTNESVRAEVDISIGKEGYYSTVANVDLTYYNGKVSAIIVHDPTLLAYHVSEKWEGGARIYSNAEIQEIIDHLKTLDGTEEIVERLERGLLRTKAST